MARSDVIPLKQAAWAWARVALQSFGGPAGQIAVMHRVLVDERRWIGPNRFLHALNFCTLLPGPEAQQLAVYIGWLLNGIRGGLLAGWLFVLPGVVALYGLSVIYVSYGDTTLVNGLLSGVAPAVLAIVVQALARIAGRALSGRGLALIAVAAFVALAVFGVPFPAVVAAAGVLGWLLGRHSPQALAPDDGAADGPVPLLPDDATPYGRPTARRAVLIVSTGAVLWLVPLLLVSAWLGWASTPAAQGRFFSGMALVTFGGAYAVLAYVAQRAVEDFGWLGPREMVRGLALAETTPGPLIMVVQFVAFVGAYRSPGDLNPWVAATVGALLTTWVTFVPSFVLVFLGAPYVERLRHNATLRTALAGVTAAVVGVIANLAVYFATHTLFRETTTVDEGPLSLQVPDLTTARPLSLTVAVISAVLLLRFRWSVLPTLGVCAAIGLGWTVLTQLR